MDGSRQGLRDELEVRLLNVEQESARVTSENATLKQLIMESRHKQAVMQDKMERVLKTLYNVFMGGGNSNNLSISTNSTIVPAPTRSSLGPQMMENLLFRLDSLQSYGLRYLDSLDDLCNVTQCPCINASVVTWVDAWGCLHAWQLSLTLLYSPVFTILKNELRHCEHPWGRGHRVHIWGGGHCAAQHDSWGYDNVGDVIEER